MNDKYEHSLTTLYHVSFIIESIKKDVDSGEIEQASSRLERLAKNILIKLKEFEKDAENE